MRSNLLTAAIALMFATAPVLAEVTGAKTDQNTPTVQEEGLDTNLRALSPTELDAVKGGQGAASSTSGIVVVAGGGCCGPANQQNNANNQNVADTGF
jgi:hypothetical protein